MGILTNEMMWVFLGFSGQALFFSRFIVQWVSSEKEGKSVIPVSFWYLSIVGSIITLAYAVYRGDPVFIAGMSVGSFVYARNLYFIYRKKE